MYIIIYTYRFEQMHKIGDIVYISCDIPNIYPDYSGIYIISNISTGKYLPFTRYSPFNNDDVSMLTIRNLDNNNYIHMLDKDGKWTMYNTNINYKIEIIEPKILTYNRHIDMHILSHFNDKTLGVMSRVNKYLNSLYNDNTLWYLKLNVLFPGVPIPDKSKNCIKDLYMGIVMFENWDVELDKWQNLSNVSCNFGLLYIVTWLAETKHVFPKQVFVNRTIQPIIDYLDQYDMKPTLLDDDT